MENNKGLVFLDLANRPYLCRKWGDENTLWLFYWHIENHWVSLREVERDEKFPENLTQSEQNMYHSQHEKWEQKFNKTHRAEP